MAPAEAESIRPPLTTEQPVGCYLRQGLLCELPGPSLPPYSSYHSFPSLPDPTFCLHLPLALYRLWLWLGERSSLRITQLRGGSSYPNGCCCQVSRGLKPGPPHSALTPNLQAYLRAPELFPKFSIKCSINADLTSWTPPSVAQQP